MRDLSTRGGSERPKLNALATRLGIEPRYRAPLGQTIVEVADDTREALVSAMGWDASSETAAQRSLASFVARAETAPLAGQSALHIDEVLGAGRAFGFWANLYSVRASGQDGSPLTGGFGGFAELSLLIDHAAREGAAFVGLNPLHAVAHGVGACCPYLPQSRLFRSPLYLDVSRVPELSASARAQERLASDALHRELARLRASPLLDPQSLQGVVDPLLRELYASFLAGQGTRADRRRSDFEAYRRKQGEALARFATFEALAVRFARDASLAATESSDWRRWPTAYRRPDESAVEEFRRAQSADVDFHAWLQFEVDRQLGQLAGHARDSGLAIGLYGDLALGSAPGGSDAWANPTAFAAGVSVGAPPDAFSPDGQNWGFPPQDPHVAQHSGYAFFESLIEANTAHVGALRVDHALGLRRLFWIPEGCKPSEGAYVRQPEHDLLSLLGRASRRGGVLLVGEDLGNVPDGFSQAMQSAGLLSSRVLMFERDEVGGFLPATSYPRTCLASVNTHDLPPLAAWLGDGADLMLRRAAGQLPDDPSFERAVAERAVDRSAFIERMRNDGWLGSDDGAALGLTSLAEAATRFLCSSPAALVGIAVDDLAGETTPINLPGIPAEGHPSWRRMLPDDVETIFESERAQRILAAVPAELRAPRRLV